MAKKQIPNSFITLILKYQDEGCDNKSALRDMITDALHYCEEQGFEFSEILEGATEVYNEEREDDFVDCQFTSVWDDGSVVTTNCKYNLETGYLEPEVSNGQVPTGTLEREFITLEDGEEKEVCPDCHEYLLKTVVGDRSDCSFGEMTECMDSDCPSREEDDE